MQVPQQSGDRILETKRKIPDDAVKIRKINRPFRLKDHTVATHEQTKQRLPSLYSQKKCSGRWNSNTFQ